MLQTIEKYRSALEQAGALDIEFFVEKLFSNINVPENFHDLLLEGRAALMLLNNKFGVTMRDSPDLSVNIGNNHFFAEVKHFREKEQDRIDRANLETSSKELDNLDTLVEFGDTIPLEGVTPWQQLAQVVKNKLKKYKYNHPYILIVGSDSDSCITSLEVPTAINILFDDYNDGDLPDLVKLNGILFIDMKNEFSLSDPRNVYFFPVPLKPLDTMVRDALNSIRWI